jgi:hypothetical protein
LTFQAIDGTGARVYMPSHEEEPHKSASPPRLRGVWARLKTRMPPDDAPRRIFIKIRRVIVRSYKTTEI